METENNNNNQHITINDDDDDDDDDGTTVSNSFLIKDTLTASDRIEIVTDNIHRLCDRDTRAVMYEVLVQLSQNLQAGRSALRLANRQLREQEGSSEGIDKVSNYIYDDQNANYKAI